MQASAKQPAVAAKPAKEKKVQRWNIQHRLQHGTLALSMIGLLGTGLPIKYSYTGWAPTVFKLLGGFHSTLIIHKVSASLLVFVSAWHLFYLLIGWRKWGISLAMVPTLKDVKDAGDHGLFLLGLKDHPPQYDRYSYLEKFEYLAIFWGMVVMGLSGFALWFPVTFASVVPRWGLDLLRIIHSNEAFVALISLAFGHFFFAHFSPQVFPSSPVWYSGELPLSHYYEEHPLEVERMVEKGLISKEEVHHAKHSHSLKLAGWRRIVGVVELLIYSAIFYWMLVTFIPLLLG